MIKKISILVEKYTCEKRYLDAKRVKEYFLQNNYQLINNPKKADIILFITCAASEIQAEFSLKRIKELSRLNGELIVGGCLPAIDENKLREVFSGRTIITKDLNQIDAMFPDNMIKFSEILDSNTLTSNFGVNFQNNPWNYYYSLRDFFIRNMLGKKSFIYSEIAKTPFFYITCSTGCLGNCSYCAIKKATGSLVSKTIENCLNEFKSGLHAGYKHFKIVGDDVGAYGIDIGENLPRLLDSLTKVPGDYEITVQSIHPQWIVKYIDDIERILQRGKIVHLAILIQSANPRILEMMNRYSNIGKIKNAFARIRVVRPELKINTHCIVGFPSESMAEFKETLAFVSDYNLSGYFYFYSERPNTRALSLESKISDKEKIVRLNFARKYLKKNGYWVLYLASKKFFMFDPGNKMKEFTRNN